MLRETCQMKVYRSPRQSEGAGQGGGTRSGREHAARGSRREGSGQSSARACRTSPLPPLHVILADGQTR